MGLFNVVISAKAQNDRAECVSFVRNVSKEAAKKLVLEMHNQILSLEKFPERNPIFEMSKSFPFLVMKLVINSRYIVFYTIEAKNIVVYRILDSRRKFDGLLL